MSPLELADFGSRLNVDRLCLVAVGLALVESAAGIGAEVANASMLRFTDASAASPRPLAACNSTYRYQ